MKFDWKKTFVLGFGFLGISVVWPLFNINSLPLVYDVGGNHAIGALTGLYYFASSLAAIAGPIIAGGLIDLTSYSVIWLFAAVFMVLALVMMSRIRVAAPVRD
ncbi:hypothetical protein [Candidatus Amarolinea dominans]|uniref:hypothetical protein n=1 Tax=Candidatus Amarolinea dominans TaxID=3140696 RepID=UPI003135A434|nr:hypothetical protein [Anaerolineae bacterium]